MSDPIPLRVVDGSAEPGDWESLYRENVSPVFGFVFARTGNRADAEDITSQVFIRALPRLQESASGGEIRAYLFQTARTVIADFWKAKYKLEWAEPAEWDAVAPPTPQTAESDARERVTQLLERLSDPQRRLLELRFLRGYSIKEAARELGISVTNAKVTQWRALRRCAELAEGGR